MILPEVKDQRLDTEKDCKEANEDVLIADSEKIKLVEVDCKENETLKNENNDFESLDWHYF